MSTTTSTFQGFAAITDQGTPCWVMNDGKLTDGTPAYKVRLGCYGRWYGAGGMHIKRDTHYLGKIGWIAKSKITRA